MKKLFFFVVLLLCLQTTWAQKKVVVTTASMLGDMAENIAGGEVLVKTIVPIGGDPHTYEPTPRDVQLVVSADLVLKNGLTFEGWLNELIENSGTKANTVRVTEGINPIKSTQYKNSADPHAWMDASLGLIYIKNIKNALVALAPEHKETFEFNYGVYKKQLEDLDAYIFEQLQTIPEKKRVLITSHDAFQYYGRRYGIQLEAIMGTSTDAQVQTSDIKRLNKVIQANRVPAVFIESTINPKLLQQLASDNNVAVGGQLYADSIGDKDSPAPTYIDMLKSNTDVIVQALSKEFTATSVATEHGEGSGNNLWLWGAIAGIMLIGFLVVAKMK